VLDAKYRDLWTTSLPRDMLYQLTLYALAHPTRSAAILYPTADAAARLQRIVVQDPVGSGHLARVSLVPVALDELGALVAADGAAAARDRTTLALSLVSTSETVARPR
jgi:5-methylcytosine-specific restriction enzyme subunit McrC